MVELDHDGKVNLGITNELAARMTNYKGLGPTKTTANIAFHFWNYIAVGGFFYTVYLSFASSWWWFLIGFWGAVMVFRSNKKANSTNYINAAIDDEEFYERVRNVNGWLYQMEEETYKELLQDERTQ